ncbi:unnamed protein product [Callosobruchus maculatus]|uniref:Mitochondrial carrier protein n=1 Tax=Callosobruchus maculatus TaxID=64391 RepID=A0A653D515_CALMS|nr:unnamed protein product [Callosobruchus maculatus]
MFFWIDFLAGWMGGITSLIVGHPLETVKVRQQAYNTSLLKTVLHTFKYEGIFGFYKGMLFPIFTYGPSNSIFFGVYANALILLGPSNQDHANSISSGTALDIYIAGCIASIPQTLFYSPIEYIKIIMQADTLVSDDRKLGRETKLTPAYRNTLEAFKYVYKTRGLLGLYTGLWPTMIREVPTGGIYTLVHQKLRYHSLEEAGLTEVSKEIIAGGMAGILSIAVAVPMDVVKTRIQTDDPLDKRYFGIIQTALKLYKEEGSAIFFKGMVVTCLRAFPVHAAMFTTYEFVTGLYDKIK